MPATAHPRDDDVLDTLEALELELGLDTTIETDEQSARRTLRGQIARLERQLSACVISTFGQAPLDTRVPAPGGPRLLALGELERLRDDLAERLRRARLELAARGAAQDRGRALLERMRVDPAAHRHVRIARAELGEPGCGHWAVRPQLGPIGRLMGWWRVKLSSGCPLAGRASVPAP